METTYANAYVTNESRKTIVSYLSTMAPRLSDVIKAVVSLDFRSVGLTAVSTKLITYFIASSKAQTISWNVKNMLKVGILN